MSIARHHADWLSLVEVSGPFLSMRVLERVFPQGLDDNTPELRKRLSQAHEEWLDNQQGLRPDPALHRQWIKYVLREVLGYEETDLVSGQALPPALSVTLAQHHETLRPTFAILEPADRPHAGKARLVIELVPPGQSLDDIVPGKPWKASPATRLATLLQSSGSRLGLLTNGRHFMLVHAAPNETTSFVSFYSHLFFEEPITLRAFQSLLSLRRLFGVADADTLEALFAESSKDAFEVTDQLGLQVRRAVQILIQSIDRIDRDRQRTLLQGLTEETLYHAAVTVMMRLVFLLAAEERNLLLSGQELYDAHYAVSTLRDQLQEVADKQGEEVLERRYAAWSRLLATFRAVYGGVTHEDLRLPAYGGSLFDPDRFPFLEGRRPGSSWKDPAANVPPLPMDDRTVLQLLRSLQLLEMKVGTGLYETRRLSFRELGVEGIGHVYEGLLDHTAKRAKGPVLALQGGVDVEVEVLEKAQSNLREKITDYVANLTGRASKTVQKNIEYKIPRDDERHWLVACDNVLDVYKRIEPWAGLVRKDAEKPAVVPPGSVYVTAGTERRATGTHYTPPSLTEPIVKHTLEPLVYVGPAEGVPEANWKLRCPEELLRLKVCDLAMGSGAFLVQACRYLADRLVEAWAAEEERAGGKLVMTPDGRLSAGDPIERLLPMDENERKALAKRYVADRCLYGVDKNPMAVEMAKLSLWLETLQKDRPFTFLDHALKSGDSLLGLTSAEQLEKFHLQTTATGQMPLGGDVAKNALQKAREKREELESFAVIGPEDTARKTHLLHEADAATADVRLVADVIVGAAISTATKGEKALNKRLDDLAPLVADFVKSRSAERREDLRRRAEEMLNEGRGAQHPKRTPFHWVIEFPEVFVAHGGFDAFVGNPPFFGGTKLFSLLGQEYREYIASMIARGHTGIRGAADLCTYFLLRACNLGNIVGLVATNSISQGDGRETGLVPLLREGVTIFRANPTLPWPGTANLEVAMVWLSRQSWLGRQWLGTRDVARIDSTLSEAESGSSGPYQLLMNEEKCLTGAKLSSLGFLLSKVEADQLLATEKQAKDVIHPYLNGEDLNRSADLHPSRWVIHFRDWPLRHDDAEPGYKGPAAEDYPLCLRIIEERVRPARQLLTEDTAWNRKLKRLWWQFGQDRMALYAIIKDKTSILARARVSNTHAVVPVPTSWVANEKVVLFVTESLAILQSNVHESWARKYGTTLRTDMVYAGAQCFETFPFPPLWETNARLEDIGKRYYEFRAALMVENNEGLTKTYNRFHHPEERSAKIVELRRLHAEMDRAVLDAYGWTDVLPVYDFRKQLDESIRYTWGEETRDEVLGKLLELNHARYQEEVAAGLHEKGKAKKEKADKPVAPAAEVSTGQTGFDFASGPAAAPAKGKAAGKRGAKGRG